MAKNLSEFKYLAFDVVGTLIDFEGGLKASLIEIGQSAGVEVDGEEALALYRQARYSDDAGLFPDDLVRVYLAIAPKLGLTNCGIERRHAQQGYGGTIEPSGVIQPGYHFTSMAACPRPHERRHLPEYCRIRTQKADQRTSATIYKRELL
jgi:FMN phosphatase YigB (HAD superfamily)